LFAGRTRSPLPAAATAREDRRDRTIAPYQLPDIGATELLRFKIGLDGLEHRLLGKGDCAVTIVSGVEMDSLLEAGGSYRVQLAAAQEAGAKTGLIYFGRENSIRKIRKAVQNLGLVAVRDPVEPDESQVIAQEILAPPCETVFIPSGLNTPKLASALREVRG